MTIASAVLRVARPTNNLERIARMYADGLGFDVLAGFDNHDGFDGVILGHRHAPYHLEFTSHRERAAGDAPGPDHLLVFYVPDQVEWKAACEQLEAVGFRAVASWNPFWDRDGRTFEDVDGSRVVLQNGEWTI